MHLLLWHARGWPALMGDITTNCFPYHVDENAMEWIAVPWLPHSLTCSRQRRLADRGGVCCHGARMAGAAICSQGEGLARIRGGQWACGLLRQIGGLTQN